jgi:hypothetical protein
MTPYQYGQAAAPSNMAFPADAYMKAAGNAAAMQQRGMEQMGAGLAKGIDSVSQYLKESRDINSAVKGGEKFLSYLGKSGVQSGAFGQQDLDAVSAALSDPSLSPRDKANLIPMISQNMMGQIKQQQSIDLSRKQMLAQAQLKAAESGMPMQYGPSPNVPQRNQQQGAVSVDLNNMGGDFSQPSQKLDMSDTFYPQGQGSLSLPQTSTYDHSFDLFGN